MASTDNIPLIKDIQDSVLKLCLERLKNDRTIEIDGIICISHGKQDNNIVVKMHRTILKPKKCLNGSQEVKASSRLRRSIEAARDALRQSTRRKSQRKKINFPLNSSNGDVTIEVQCNSGDDNTLTRKKRQNAESIMHLSPKSQKRETDTEHMHDEETTQASQNKFSAIEDPGFPESCVLGGIMAQQASKLDIMNKAKLSNGTHRASSSSTVHGISNADAIESSGTHAVGISTGVNNSVAQHGVSVQSNAVIKDQLNLSPKSKQSKIGKLNLGKFPNSQTQSNMSNKEAKGDTRNLTKSELTHRGASLAHRDNGVTQRDTTKTHRDVSVTNEPTSGSQRLAQSLSESVSSSKLEAIEIYKYKRSPNESLRMRQRRHVRRGSSCRTNLQNSFSKADLIQRKSEDFMEKKSCISRGRSSRSQNRGVRFENLDRTQSVNTQNITYPLPQVAIPKCDMTHPMPELPKTTVVSHNNYINIERKRRVSGRQTTHTKIPAKQKPEALDESDISKTRSIVDAPVKQKKTILNAGKNLDRNTWTSDSDTCDYISMDKVEGTLDDTKTDKANDTTSEIKDSTNNTQKQLKPDLFNLDRSFLVDRSDLSHNWVKEERRTRIDSGQFPIKSNRRSFENLILSRQDKRRKSANSVLTASSKPTDKEYHPEISRRHPCKICGKVLNSVGQLWNHQKVHEVLKCPQCDEKFQDHNCFMMHFTEVHKVDSAADSLIKDLSVTIGH